MTAVEHPGIENRSLYGCAVCGASTPVVVMGLIDPRSLVSEKDVQGLKESAALKARFGQPADHDPRATMCADLLDEFTKEKLLYATCPRCMKRNPAGVEANAKTRRRARLLGTSISLAVALLIVRAPPAAWGVVTISVVLTFLTTALVRPRRWRTFAYNLGGVLALTAVTLLYPRAAAAAPALLAIRYAFPRASDQPWTDAAKCLRFETPYR